MLFICHYLLSDIRAEMMPDELPDRSEVSNFDHSKLKHVATTEKVILPSKEGEMSLLARTSAKIELLVVLGISYNFIINFREKNWFVQTDWS